MATAASSARLAPWKSEAASDVGRLACVAPSASPCRGAPAARASVGACGGRGHVLALRCDAAQRFAGARKSACVASAASPPRSAECLARLVSSRRRGRYEHAASLCCDARTNLAHDGPGNVAGCASSSLDHYLGASSASLQPRRKLAKKQTKQKA